MTTQTPTETPTKTPAKDVVYGPNGRDKPTPPISEFPVRMVGPVTAEVDENEFLVDVETHVAVLVRATTPETAVAKAVLHTIEPELDGSVTEVGRNVHTCVHSGLDDGEECDQHGEHEEKV